MKAWPADGRAGSTSSAATARRSRPNSRRVTLRPARRCLLSFQLQFHRLVDCMAVVPWAAWHVDDYGEVLRGFVAISFGLLLRDRLCARCDQINRRKQH